MRAIEPEQAGFAERDGVRIAWERFGAGERAVLFVPTWHLVHSRVSKMQVPYLARRFCVVTYDPRGNGRSDRPPVGYRIDDYCADALAVMDAAGLRSAAVVTASQGANQAVLLATLAPERVERLVLVGPAIGLGAQDDSWFFEERERYDGWEKYSAPHMLADYEDFLWFFFEQCFSEPHSTKPVEDCVGWALETTPEVIVQGKREFDGGPIHDLLPQVGCSTLIVHGEDDRVVPLAAAAAVRDAIPHAQLVVVEGGGHRPDIRDPVSFNHLLVDFLGGGEPSGERRVSRALHRSRPRALWLSSPIGLGHAQRDLAIVRELRRLRPDLEVIWLAQDPVTRVLEAAGEKIHPASRLLASEAGHIESLAGEHRLQVLQAIREMDEILLANFMVFADVVRAEPYDLWVGDEAWELDHHLHDNPELKTAPYAFLTDFVGWLPMDESPGSREAFVAADMNHETIRQIERFPYLRDAAVFVGDPDDLVPRAFGPGLPSIPEWGQRHFDFCGYALPFDPAGPVDPDQVRRERGFDPGRPLLVASAGGTATGLHLLRRTAAAFGLLRRALPEAQLLLVCGPRIDPAAIEAVEDMHVATYVHHLHRLHACCDLAIVQGGLTTTMELVAASRPFVHVPIRDHSEQHHHVAHRLSRHRAPGPTPYEQATPERLAELMLERLGTEVAYRPVPPGGAERAARLLAPLLEERKGRPIAFTNHHPKEEHHATHSA